MKKYISLIIAFMFLVNNIAYGLGVAPGSHVPATRNAVLTMAQKKVLVKRGPGMKALQHYPYGSGFEGEQFLSGEDRIDIRKAPYNVDFNVTADYADLPEGWKNNPLLQQTDLIDAFEYFRDNEACIPASKLEIKKGYFTVKEGELPIDVIHKTKEGEEKYILIIHEDFVDKWNQLREKDVWFKANIGTAQEPDMRTVSVAWGVFYRVAKHVMGDLDGEAFKAGTFKLKSPEGFGHLWYDGKEIREEGEDKANIPSGQYGLINEAIWAWFLTVNFGDPTRRSNNIFQKRLEWILDDENEDAEELGLYKEFPSLVGDEENLKAVVAIACAINYAAYKREIDLSKIARKTGPEKAEKDKEYLQKLREGQYREIYRGTWQGEDHLWKLLRKLDKFKDNTGRWAIDALKEVENDLGIISDKRAVEPFIRALEDKSLNIRRYAAEALGRIGDKRAFQPLLRALKDQHSGVRYVVAVALGEIGDNRAVEPLIRVLKDSQLGAAEALGKIGDKRAVQPLIKTLQDNEPWVRVAAAEALGHIGDKRAVEPLIRVLEDENEYVRRAAAEALGKIGDKRAVEPLILQVLKEEKEYSCKTGIEALVKIGGKRAIEPLVQLLSAERWKTGLTYSRSFAVRQAAAVALGMLGDERAVEPLVIECLRQGRMPGGRNDEVYKAATEAMNKIDDKKIVEPLIKVLKNEYALSRRIAVEYLGERGDDRVVEPLIQVLRGDEDLTVRQAAVKVLGNIGDERSVQPLIKVLKDEKDGDICTAAAKILGQIGGKSAVEPLMLALKDKRDRDIRTAVAEILGQIGGKSAVQSLILALMDKDEYVCANAAIALGRIGDNEAVEPLIQALKDKNKDIRKVAARALGKIGDVKALKPLIQILFKDKDYSVRQHAAEALGEIGDKRAVPFLMQALGSKKKDIGDEETYEYRVLIKGRTDMCSTVALALGKISDKRAVPLLVRILLEEEGDYSVRSAAASALGEIGDKRAIPFLVQTLRDPYKNASEEARRIAREMRKLLLLGKKIDTKKLESLKSRNLILKDKDKVAFEDETEKIRRAAVYALGAISGDEAIQVLTQALKDKSEGIREAAAAALNKIVDKSVARPLIQALMDKEKDAFETAAKALGETGNKTAVESLAQDLKDQDVGVRYAAVEALGKIGDKRAVQPLTQVLKDKKAHVRQFAAEILGQIGGKEAIPSLTQVLKDEDEYVRKTATEALEKIRSKTAPATEYFSSGAEVNWSEWEVVDPDTLCAKGQKGVIAKRGPEGKFDIMSGGLPVDPIDKEVLTHIRALKDTDKDVREAAIVTEISRYILRIRDEDDKGPGVMRKLKPEELQRIWESVNLLHKTNMHIFVPQSVKLTFEINQAITAMKLRGVPIEVTRYSVRNDRALQKFLSELDDEITEGVKKIVLTDTASADAINAYLTTAENLKSATTFKNVRLLNMVIPGKWKSNQQKTVFQAQLLRTAILARLLEEGESHFLDIKAQLSETLEDSFTSSEITTGQFIEQLIETDAPEAEPEEILNRIQPFLSGKLAIRLIKKLEWDLHALKKFWAAA